MEFATNRRVSKQFKNACIHGLQTSVYGLLAEPSQQMCAEVMYLVSFRSVCFR